MSANCSVRRETIDNNGRRRRISLLINPLNQIDNQTNFHSQTNTSHQLATISQLCLPFGNEYRAQKRLRPIGPEAQLPFILETNENYPNRYSMTTEICQSTDEDDQQSENILNKKTRTILFLLEPILGAFLLFPILTLFWHSAWNLSLILTNSLNQFPIYYNIDKDIPLTYGQYSWQSLFSIYFLLQLILFLFYVCQNLIYNFFKNRQWILQKFFLEIHIFLLSIVYVLQWKILWSVWDQLIPRNWQFEIAFSTGSIFALIVFDGHLSSLVCSPFVLSYDSIEYSIHFGSSLLTRQMKEWKMNILNYILLEIIEMNICVTIWIGFYHLLDDYFYPNDVHKSFGICLLIGYLLYFPLMYFQSYLENLNVKYEFWRFLSINFPQFYRNIRHFFAFLSCLFLWHGYWQMFDQYISIFEQPYQTYIFICLLTFLILLIFQTASSLNGPLSDIKDPNEFFPLYSHCYISIVQRKLSKYFSSKQNL